MPSVEFMTSNFGPIRDTYGIYVPSRILFRPDQLSVCVSLNKHQVSGEGQLLAVLMGVEQTEDTIHAQWASGYGKHNTLLRELTDNPQAALSEQVHEIAIGKNVLELEGVCGIELENYVPMLSICGRYFAESSLDGQRKLVSLDDPAKRIISDLAVASSAEIMTLKQVTEATVTIQHSFEMPAGDFTEYIQLGLNLQDQ